MNEAGNHLVLHADGGSGSICRHIYGHFAEHLGRCVYGGFYVGEENKTIPHRRGVRNDVIQALKALRIPNLRWPGGCFADTYHWKDGIGRRDKRPATVNRWWGNVTEDNSFGTHDFLDLCEELGAEPYISANVGTGTAQELADWVQYVNLEGTGPLSALRKKNGRGDPWRVKYWGIGNEAWGCGGNMTPAHYAGIYRQFATFMNNGSDACPLFRVASGAGSEDYYWTEVLMREIPLPLLEGISLHHYAVADWDNKGPATGFSEEQYMQTMKKALLLDELIARHAAIMDRYDPDKNVALVVDEWGGWYEVEKDTNPSFLYQQNTMRDAVLAAATLNIFHKYCDRVRMANLAQAVNVLQAVILTEGDSIVLTPTYHVMEMYKVHQDAILIPSTLACAGYSLHDDTLPAVSASASRDAAGNVHISIANIHPRASQEMIVQVVGPSLRPAGARVLSAPGIGDHNTFRMREAVKPSPFDGAHARGRDIVINMPPASVVVLRLE